MLGSECSYGRFREMAFGKMMVSRMGRGAYERYAMDKDKTMRHLEMIAILANEMREDVLCGRRIDEVVAGLGDIRVLCDNAEDAFTGEE